MDSFKRSFLLSSEIIYGDIAKTSSKLGGKPGFAGLQVDYQNWPVPTFMPCFSVSYVPFTAFASHFPRENIYHVAHTTLSGPES